MVSITKVPRVEDSAANQSEAAPPQRRTGRASGGTTKVGAALGRYLREWYVAQGWSRKEAAAKGGVSDGYLCHLLAGDIEFPRPKVFRRLAYGWGFNPAEALLAALLQSMEDVTRLASQQGDAQTNFSRNWLPADIQQIVQTLMAMPPELREIAIPSVQNHLYSFQRMASVAQPLQQNGASTRRRKVSV